MSEVTPDDLTDNAGTPGHSSPRERVRRHTDWLMGRPWVVAIILAVIGLAVRHAWLSPGPLSAGDWKWPTRGRLLEYFPWPSVWNNTLGLSGENRFLDAFRFPVYAVNGFIAATGATWTVVEKVVYFVPFAVLLPVAGWLLAREILGNTRWTWLAPLLLLGNTYFLVEANGEIPLVMAEAIGCVALVTFLRAMRRLSMKWALITGLLVGASAAMDLRPAYLTGLLMVGYLVVLALAEPGWALWRRRIWLSGATALTFIGTQMFWIVPLATYKGHPAFPTPRTPDFNILTLEHGLAGVVASWSGGTPAPFAQAPLNPIYMVLPLLAMLPLIWRRMRVELVWLALAAVVCAFLAKTNNPPFGQVYDWLYLHLPGFNLFREGSKFLYPIAIAYAVLIPAAFASLVELAGRVRRRAAGIKTVIGIALALVLVVVGSSLLVLERGQLGSTTATAPEPRAFKQVTSLLAADHQAGSVMWFGAPVFVTGNQYQDDHTYTITSATHPLNNLSGSVLSSVVQSRDVFQYFCPVITQSYCYVNPSVLPYLVGMVGASYIISPGSADVGLLPSGITRGWLRQHLSAMFGPPATIGNGATQFLVWHLRNPRPMIANYPAVALVDSGPWSLGNVLPALQAMGVPAAYRQSFDVSDYPAARANLPDTVPVFARTGGACPGSSGGSVGVMARTSTGSLQVVAGSTRTTLPLLARSSRLPGWGVFGPLRVPAGSAQIATPTPGITLGPCVSWSGLAAAAFGPHSQPAGATRSAANGEQLRASATGATGPWTELRQTYDPGWRLGGKAPQAVADGLFSLYHPAHPVTSPRSFVFTFSTLKWEHRGLIISIVAWLVAIFAIWRLALRERRRPPPATREVFVDSRVGAVMGGLGELLLVLCGLAVVLAWFGVPSRFPSLAITSNPYNLDVVFATVALVLLGGSLVVRLGENLVHHLRARTPVEAPATEPRRRRQVATVAGVSAAVAILAASCGAGNSHSANQAFSSAQQAGATSRLVSGFTLQDAQMQAQANDAPKCIADYTTALKTFPRLASAYFGRAQCYQSGGLNFPAAIHDYTRALSLSPDNPAYLLGRASADQGAGNLGAAARDYEAAASAPAASPTQSLAAIDGLLNMRDVTIATKVLNQATNRFPADGLIRLGAADLAVVNGNDGGGAALMAQAAGLARKSPDPVELVSVLGRICGFQTINLQYQQALASCQQAAQQAAATGQDPSGAFDNLSAVEAGLGRLEPAIAHLTSAIGAFQGNVGTDAQPAGVDGFGLAFLYEARGRLLIEDHRTQQAISDYRQALASLPSGLPDFAARLRSDIAAARHD